MEDLYSQQIEESIRDSEEAYNYATNIVETHDFNAQRFEGLPLETLQDNILVIEKLREDTLILGNREVTSLFDEQLQVLTSY